MLLHLDLQFHHLAQHLQVGAVHRQVQAVAELNAEIDNLRAAWHWAATQHQIDLMRQSARALYWYYDLRNLAHEGAALFEQAIADAQTLAHNPAWEIAMGHWLAFQAMFVYRQNRLADAKQILEQSLALLEKHGDSAELIDALWILGQVTWARGEFGESARHLHRALDARRAIRSPWQMTTCSLLLGTVEYELGNYVDSYSLLTESLTIARAQGDPTLISYAISALSRSAHQPGRLSEIETLLREGCQLAQESGNRFAVALSLAQLADVVWTKGNAREAKRLCRESIAVCRDQGDDWGLCSTLNQLANFEMSEGQAREAWPYLSEALRVALRGGFHSNVLDVLVSIAAVCAKSGDVMGALEIVAQVLQDSATKYQSQTRAERLRAELESRLTLPQIEVAQARARGKRLDQQAARVIVAAVTVRCARATSHSAMSPRVSIGAAVCRCARKNSSLLYSAEANASSVLPISAV